MQMKFYEVTYILDNETQERLSLLTKRYNKIKGWNERDALQFAVASTLKEDMEMKLQFLESRIDELEREAQSQMENKILEKETYISDEEREKCRKVLNAYKEEMEENNILIVEAGKFGFVKLQYYKPPYGFDDAKTFNNSLLLFIDLWEEWLYAQLLNLTKDTPIAELDYEDMFKYLPKDKQDELMSKREYFAEKSELVLN